MAKKLGIMGCGQLSQMMGEAANRQGYEVAFLCLDETPVVQGLGPIFEQADLSAFLAGRDAITVERESIPDPILRRAAQEVGLAPNYEALVTIRQRDTQKALLDSLEIPTSPWRAATTPDELAAAVAELPSEQVRCKRILGGYDGGGQWRVEASTVSRVPEGGYPLIAEAEIAIEQELAIVVARDVYGDTCVYPVTENAMRDGILIGSFVPANASPSLVGEASVYARRLANAMNYVGVLAVEFFVSDGKLMVNEMAPRVHNTGHWTIGTLGPDQFTQHVRTVLGEAVTPPDLTGAAAIINLLDEQLPAAMPAGGIRMLMQTYGKGVRKGRKLGHLTLIGDDAASVRALGEQMISELH